MKEKINHAIKIICFLAFCLILFSYAYWNGGSIDSIVKVSVLLSAENSEQWEILRHGINSFAKENKIEVNYINLTGEESVQEQMDIIRRELQNGAEGFIVNLPNKNVLVKQINESLNQEKLVMVGSSLPLDFECGYINVDSKAMGRDLAYAALEDIPDSKRLGILIGNRDMKAVNERLEGVKEVLGEQIAFIAFKPEEIAKKDWKKAEGVLCLDTKAGELLLEEAEKGNKKLYVIGRTEKLVYYLDKGLIDTMMVTDEFVMGYTALESLFSQVRYYGEIENKTVSYILINKQNLYSEDNERIVFPWVQ